MLSLKPLVAIFLFSQVIRAVCTILFNQLPDFQYYGEQIAVTIMYGMLFALCIHVLKLGKTSLLLLSGPVPPIGMLLSAMLCALLLLMITLGESAVVTFALAQHDPLYAYQSGRFHENALPYRAFFSLHVLTFIVAGVILPAIVEEFFFRALLLRALADRCGMLIAAVLVSGVFSALHFSKMLFISTFIFSLALCYVYLITGSLWIIATIHAAYNLFAFVIQHYYDFHRIRTIHEISSIADWIPELAMSGVAMLVLAVLAKKYHAQADSSSQLAEISCTAST